jgi:dTDP-4-dehydrorhamnose reductase
MKLLLTGQNGQLGFELQRALAPLGELIKVDATECDLADPVAVQTLLEREQPAVIVNPAAYTAVDRAESEPELAAAVNTNAPRQFGAWASATGALVLHYSTDYVFDGTKADPYVEEDVTAPLGVYGLTKRDGESALRQNCPRHLILRTSWVVGAHGANFAKTMLRLAAERDSLRVVNDQWGAPTSAALLADLTAHLVRQWANQERSSGDSFPYGTYHVANAGETNWYDYARFVLAAHIRLGAACASHPIRSRRLPLPTIPPRRPDPPTRGSTAAASATPSACTCRHGSRACATSWRRSWRRAEPWFRERCIYAVLPDGVAVE